MQKKYISKKNMLGCKKPYSVLYGKSYIKNELFNITFESVYGFTLDKFLFLLWGLNVRN